MRSGDGVVILKGLRLRSGRGFRNRDRRIFDDILDNSDKTDFVGRALEDSYQTKFIEFETEVANELAAGADGPIDGPFIRFFKWVIANQDAVLAFIKTIIGMFLVADANTNTSIDTDL